MEQTQGPTASGPKESAENLSDAELIARLSAGKPQEEPAAEEESPTEETQVEEVAEESEAEETEAATEDDEPEAEGEIDLLSLEPEQLQALAKKSKSRLLERVGELSAKSKAMQAQLDELRQKQSQAPEVPHEKNPFKDLKSLDDIKTRHAQIEQTLEQTDALLEEYEDYGSDDVIIVGGQEYTKKQIKQANRNAREALTKFLPAQGQHLMKLEAMKAANVQWFDRAKKEVPEIQDEESELGKNFKALVEDPLIKRLKDELPELGVQAEYLLAHAAKSMFASKTKVQQGAGSKVKVKPPASPVGAGAARSKTGGDSAYRSALQRFYDSGDPNDWVKAESLKPR